MPQVGLEPTIPVSERAKPVHALEHRDNYDKDQWDMKRK
jgi:hypothetical protein